jgi:hypothetical protein
MRNKLILFLGALIALALAYSMSSQDEQGPPLNKALQITRQAFNVVMFERKRATGKTLEVSAREVDETGGQVVRLKDFRLKQSGGLSLKGKDANYDRSRSLLEIKGLVDFETENGYQGSLKDLTWDRGKDRGRTDNPVHFAGSDGSITADRAEFSQGFTSIAFIGNVHAQIMQNILNP